MTRVSEAGATYVGACAVRLQPETEKRYLPFIEQEFPHLAERYRNTYANSACAGEKVMPRRNGWLLPEAVREVRRAGLDGRYDEERDESPGSALVPNRAASVLQLARAGLAQGAEQCPLRYCLLLGVEWAGFFPSPHPRWLRALAFSFRFSRRSARAHAVVAGRASALRGRCFGRAEANVHRGKQRAGVCWRS